MTYFHKPKDKMTSSTFMCYLHVGYVLHALGSNMMSVHNYTVPNIVCAVVDLEV